MRKILLITAGVLTLLILVWIFLFPRNSAPVIDQIQNYLPFGSGDGLDTPTATEDGGAFGQFNDLNLPEASLRDTLFQISKNPVAGASFVTSSSTIAVRYVERATGHIYDFDLNTFETKKITNQTIPKVYEAIFNASGNKVVYQMIKDGGTPENISLTITPPRTSSTTTGELHSLVATILREDMGDIVSGPDNTLYYLLKDASAVVSSNFEGENLKTLFTSAFNNWRISLSGKNLLLWTKSTASTPGFAYTLNTSNGRLTKVIGPLDGLTINPSPSGGNLLYSINYQNKTGLNAISNTSNESVEIIPVTLPEKCVWSTKTEDLIFCGTPSSIGQGEPDNWYKGITQFSDKIWSYKVYSEEGRILAEPKSLTGMDVDVTHPRLSPDEDYLIFINKRDLSLWALKIE